MVDALPSVGGIRILLRILSFLAGIICVAIGFLLYPGEEGAVQSALEDLWIKIHDRHTIVLSLHTAFMQVVARQTARYFDRLFGHKLFSIRSFGTSICLSAASFGLGGFISFFGYYLTFGFIDTYGAFRLLTIGIVSL